MEKSQSHNPDVLNCLANLSSDEVFTPPKVASQILDQLPPSLWSNPKATFLDPVCKSGVFLREIAKRLDKGLEREISDRQDRLNHIFSNQIHGIGITELTALISRRTLYGTKTANGPHSFCTTFNSESGNVRFVPSDHSWDGRRCRFCGASRSNYERNGALEAHAYEFIHTSEPKDIFGMQFDVIVGNPPYQLSDGGHGRSASPIYNRFVEQAKKLKPRYLTMIIPSRWFGGGKGLGEFRREMLNDDRLRRIVDFEKASEVFPNVDLAGGVCYFLWSLNERGPCEVVNMQGGSATVSTRPLSEFPAFIRHGDAVPIIRKILATDEARMNDQVSGRKPFGLATTERPRKTGSLVLRWQSGEGPFPKGEVTAGRELIGKWKVITSYVGYDHAGNPGKDGRRKVFSKIDVIPPGTICNETYLVIGAYDSESEARNLIRYMQTRLFRFLVSQFMYSHHITRDSYSFVPVLDMSQQWTDKKLAKRYALTSEDVAFIESKIRPWESE